MVVYTRSLQYPAIKYLGTLQTSKISSTPVTKKRKADRDLDREVKQEPKQEPINENVPADPIVVESLAAQIKDLEVGS